MRFPQFTGKFILGDGGHTREVSEQDGDGALAFRSNGRGQEVDGAHIWYTLDTEKCCGFIWLLSHVEKVLTIYLTDRRSYSTLQR